MRLDHLNRLRHSMATARLTRVSMPCTLGALTLDIAVLTESGMPGLFVGQGGHWVPLEVAQNGDINPVLPHQDYVKLLRMAQAEAQKATFKTGQFFQELDAALPLIAEPRMILRTHVAAQLFPGTPEADRLHFMGFQASAKGASVSEQNLEKTRLLLGAEAFDLCRFLNRSSHWAQTASKAVRILPELAALRGEAETIRARSRARPMNPSGSPVPSGGKPERQARPVAAPSTTATAVPQVPDVTPPLRDPDQVPCEHAHECFGGGRYGKGCFEDPQNSAKGGKPWIECLCMTAAERARAEEAAAADVAPPADSSTEIAVQPANTAETARRRMVLVCGPAGSGKSTITRLLAARLPHAVPLDLDVFTAPLVDAALKSHDVTATSPGVRYLVEQVLRQGQYASLMALAFEMLSQGLTPVCAVTPGREATSFPSLREQLASSGIELRLIWLTAPADIRRARITARGEFWDGYLLHHWDTPPAVTDAVTRESLKASGIDLLVLDSAFLTADELAARAVAALA